MTTFGIVSLVVTLAMGVKRIAFSRKTRLFGEDDFYLNDALYRRYQEGRA